MEEAGPGNTGRGPWKSPPPRGGTGMRVCLRQCGTECLPFILSFSLQLQLVTFLCRVFQEGKRHQNGAGPGDTGMPAKPPSLQQCLELWRCTGRERSVGQGSGANLLGKGLPGRHNSACKGPEVECAHIAEERTYCLSGRRKDISQRPAGRHLHYQKRNSGLREGK